MKVFCLSDPHYGRDMSKYDGLWTRHEETIRARWTETVKKGDLVLIPGDISWAVTTKAVEKHLFEINSLPGRVVMSPGNHDRWWHKTERLHYDRMRFVCDGIVPLGAHWTLAATVGSDSPESPWWKPEMLAEFEAAVSRLDLVLALAARSRPGTKILLMIHYPPRWDRDRSPTAFEQIIAKYPVEIVVYGHIHGRDLKYAHNGDMAVLGRSVRYENASCDHILFKPLHVATIEGANLGW